MKRKNVEGEFAALVESPGAVRVELSAQVNPALHITWVVDAKTAARMGRALIGAAKASRNKREVARIARLTRNLFTVKPGDL